MVAHGPAGLAPLLKKLEVEVLSRAYGDVFLVAGVTSLLGMPLAFFLPARRRVSNRPAAVRMGGGTLTDKRRRP